jgi:transcriptional regulator with XRE-family HTH domain
MAGNIDFGNRLSSLRKQRGMTQSDLSKLVGIHYTHIGRYEVGRSLPSVDTLKKMAEALGTTTDFLMDGATHDSAKARLTDQELLECFQQAAQLPDDDKRLVKRFLEAFLQMRQIKHITGSKRSA